MHTSAEAKKKARSALSNEGLRIQFAIQVLASYLLCVDYQELNTSNSNTRNDNISH
jgi:hypothetical protein